MAGKPAKVSADSLEQLFGLVRMNDCIYDPSSPAHKDAAQIQNIWSSIASKMEEDNPSMTGK